MHRFIERFRTSSSEVSLEHDQVAFEHDPVALSPVVVTFPPGVLKGASMVFEAFSEHESTLA